jgi:hypothetical protein
MDMTDLRRELSPILDTTDAALLARQKTVVPLMRAEAKPADAFRINQQPPATTQNAAFLVLTAMVGGPPKTAGMRVERMWRARYETAGQACRVTGATTLGELLVRLIEWDETRDRLDYVEYVPEYQSATAVWRGRAGVSVFHPHTSDEWQEKVQHAATAEGLTRQTVVRPRLFSRAAELIAAQK